MKASKRLRRFLRSPATHTLLKPGRNCWRTESVSQTGLLVDGDDYYRAFYRAAQAAEHYILISGWQFDSGTALLRGAEAEDAQGTIHLLDFLNDLCERKPALRIYMLAWDYSMLYGLDREWFQDWHFNWSTNERLKFCYDRGESFDASHHQKFVVIDGTLGFVGGIDLCASRWDERDHRPDNPLRVNSDGSSYRTFHDLQSYHVGPFAQQLAELFKQRWQIVCGDCLDLAAPDRGPRPLVFDPSIPLTAQQVAISRTEVPQSRGDKPILEIRQLFLDAIDAAERLIYIENQYYSSEALSDALIERMRQFRRPRLEIVLVIAKDAEAFLEQLSIGIAQSRIIRRLKAVAAETGHSFGIYYPASIAADGTEVPTYIHSKLLLVDDRFLSIGSANMNNRSMGYDTELNVAWDDVPGSRLARSIRDARVNLLAEHTGLDAQAGDRLVAVDGLVDYLNGLADSGTTRLRHHPTRSLSEENLWLLTLFPNGLPFDAEIAREAQDKPGDRVADSFITKSLTSLSRLFGGWGASTG
ncbi:MAG: phospholipase D-like domain-containing protein [Candidatus Binatia bacterium]